MKFQLYRYKLGRYFLNSKAKEFSEAIAIGLNSPRKLRGHALITLAHKGPSINYVVSRGREVQKFPILLSKKTTKRGGGGKKLLF